MPGGNNNTWVPPVNFYFSVGFQWGSQKAAASFQEVSGLELEMVTRSIHPLGDEGGQILATGEIKHSHIVLKRPLEMLKQEIADWVKECFSFMVGTNKIRPCLLIISLLGADGQPYASWECTQAFPVKWSLSAMDAEKSALAIETLTLTCKTLERIK